MSNMNNRDEQQQQQQQQQQQRQPIPHQQRFAYAEQAPHLAYPSSLYNPNAYFNPNNTNTNPQPNFYHGGGGGGSGSGSPYNHTNVPNMTMNEPYHQPNQIYQPHATMQQFNDPVVPTEPDEFILDLLRKPQERLFLLKLELEIEAFIKDETKLRLDLPGMNSYQRLMVHRLAPYYKLNHYHDAMRKAVYVCKTFITELPSVRLPDVRLVNKDDDDQEPNINDNNSSSSSINSNVNNTEPMRQFKIMRRSAESNSPPSRSNNNSSEDQSKLDRKNMTYEERKTAYEEARARIFQNLENK